MPLIRYSTDTVDTQTDAVCALLNGGYLQLYDGPQPTDGDAPIDGSVLLAELHFSSPAFAPSSDGIAWANPIEMATATNTGEARWLRTLRDDHATVVFDGDIATSGAVLNLDRTFIQTDANVILSDFAYTSLKT